MRGIDFSDLERLALQVLRRDRERQVGTLRPSPDRLHRQIHHVLVDEYQDINGVQDAILSLVSREYVAGRPWRRIPPNLFCVGDVKQSIYGFRLAEPARFLERYDRFNDCEERRRKVIDLQANFRSRAPLLEALNGLFERLMTREAADIDYDESHKLRPGAIYPPAGAGAFHWRADRAAPAAAQDAIRRADAEDDEDAGGELRSDASARHRSSRRGSTS